MTPLHIAVCEDNEAELTYICKTISEHDPTVVIASFQNAESFLEHFQPGQYDLILSDIYMDTFSGIDMVEQIRPLDPQVPVAFITSSLDHTLESYRLGVLSYIEKPVKKKDLESILLIARLKKSHVPSLTIRTGKEEMRIAFSHIYYVEQKGRHLFFYLTDGEPIRIREKLDDLLPLFDGQPFYRCHKSYLVNLALVEELDKELMVFTMRNGQNVHIRRNSIGEARRAYENYRAHPFQT